MWFTTYLRCPGGRYSGEASLSLFGQVVRGLRHILKQRTLVHIISDNKKYRDDPVDFLELLPLIYGEVVWRSNNFQDMS